MQVFISYASADANRLSVAIIAESLKIYPEIEAVHYSEGNKGSLDGNILDFREKDIAMSDVFIGIFTSNSIASKTCKKEREMAISKHKRIIPLFEDVFHVPFTCQASKGINIANKEPAVIAGELYRLLVPSKKSTKPKITNKLPSNNLESPRTRILKRFILLHLPLLNLLPIFVVLNSFL